MHVDSGLAVAFCVFLFTTGMANGKLSVGISTVVGISVSILLTAALLKLKVFHPIPLACLARELLSMQGTLVNNNQTFSETKLL